MQLKMNNHKIGQTGELEKMAVNSKKLLYIVEAMGGGVFTYIVDLANELCKEYDLYIAYAIRPQTPSNYKEYFDKKIHLIKVENLGRAINLVKDFKSLGEIKKIAKKINPDIIHLHSSKAGVVGRIAFNGKNIPLFYTPHGYSFLMKNYNPIKRMLFKIIEVMCAKSNCITISCSEGEHKETRKFARRSTYVNNAINLYALQKMISQVELEEHPFTVFTLGRICYQKHPELFNQIAEKLPDIRFLWIGDGELRKELKAVNIEVTGWTDRKEAIKRSMNADAFVLTSLWEGLPISLLESMYMKKPCVVSNTIGNNNVIHNGDNGYVCDRIEDFIKGILEIQAGDAQAFADKAYRDVVEFYDTKVQARAYSRIYKKMALERV